MYKILIVDDEINYIQVIYETIHNAYPEYVIHRALNGKLALQISKNEIPDIIITDWDMPVMNGIEFIKSLKTIDVLKNIPVIMCTGAMTSSENLKIALDAGAVDFIRKPIDKIELLARTESIIMLVNSFKEIIKRDKIIAEQEKQIIENKLQKSKKELTSFSLILANQEEKIDITIEKLRELKKTIKNKENKKLLNQLINDISFRRNIDNWEEFRLHFEEVHTNFFNNLLEKYSELTQNDLKTCAFIKLKLSTKEISKITGQNQRTIEMARYRLRKKLNIHRGENLYRFISQQD